MNIIEKETYEKEFEDICIGECFKYDGDYYMKIEEVLQLGGNNVNAVDVYNGIVASFDAGDKVRPVFADLRISF